MKLYGDKNDDKESAKPTINWRNDTAFSDRPGASAAFDAEHFESGSGGRESLRSSSNPNYANATATQTPKYFTPLPLKRKSSSAAKSSVSTVKGEYRVTRLDGAGEEEDAEYKDELWEELNREAEAEALREPLLVSFLYSSILNHETLESSISYHLANRLASASMSSTQVQSLFLEALEDDEIRNDIRRDLRAVEERDPACTGLPDVLLYFKGFHALVTHRVSNYLWKSGRFVLARFLQSQVNQIFQIDIHPNATIGGGIMLDHGTGIVVGETAIIGDNVSILHGVTLGGSGKASVDRHPKIGSGVLIGAGSSVLGNVRVGDGVQIGAGSLVVEDMEDYSVCVGVPAKVIGVVTPKSEGGESPAEKMEQTDVVISLFDENKFEI
ncbi:hypothetical protein TrST_g3352 [Triparma strigata]|uniref:serine O-acetyltransferase n=1 Tax=Triparma strigata TaxID=1606541 RepID=A0A9W7EPX3_9STRA|nr:hypothetical protein TrST_g3352 [Triparma strigata]